MRTCDSLARAAAVAFVLWMGVPVGAAVPTTFPATYDGRQRLTTTFTVIRGGNAYTLTKGQRGDGSIVFDSATALHFEPSYPGGFASATASQRGGRAFRFEYEDATLQLLADYYKQELVDGGALRSSDEFRVGFGAGRLEFSRGIQKIKGRQPFHYTARRGRSVILRGTGLLTWNGAAR